MTQWETWDKFEPLGQRADDRRIGTLVALLWNITQSTNRDADDFFPNRFKVGRRRTQQEEEAELIAWATQNGFTVGHL